MRIKSDHGAPYPVKDAGIVADSLTGIHSAMAKCLFVVNISAYTRAFRCPNR
jgi:hypothetical protein